MKKIWMMSAVAAMVLTGCSQNDLTEGTESADNAINFGTTVEKASRATAKETFKENDKFGVFAYYTKDKDYADPNHSPNFMFNQEITASGSSPLTWAYEPLKYWPNNVTSDNKPGKVSFFAYWPMKDTNGNNITFTDNTTTFSNTSTGDPKVYFTVNATATSQTDLMWGVNSSGTPYLNQTKQKTNENIEFTFKHALARIGFTVKMGDDIVTESSTPGNAVTIVTLTSIELGGTVNSTTPEGDLTSVLYTNGWLNLNNTTDGVALWSSNPGTQSLKLTAASGSGNFGSTKTNVIPKDGTTLNNSSDSYLMVIPQTFKKDELNLRVKYTVTTTDSKLNSSSVVENVQVINLTAESGSILTDKKFVNGKAYSFNLTIGINSVEVSGTIAEWGTETGLDVPVTPNQSNASTTL